MITRIEIDGFKSFYKFSVNLNPFQVLIGANGAGKSNLFDAITLLSNMARYDSLYQAFQQNRGEISELFSVNPDGTRADVMRFAVEMLIDKTVTDNFGVTEDVSNNRLRYEIHIENVMEGEFKRLYVTYENLESIAKESDTWLRQHIPNNLEKGWIVRNKGRRAPYISTQDGAIYKHQDRRSGAKQENPIGKITQSILSSISRADYPTQFAVRREMLNWRFLQLDPVDLRRPARTDAPADMLLRDGSNLAAILHRLSKDDPDLIDVSRDMANLVPGVLNVYVKHFKEREEFVGGIKTILGEEFTTRVMSDGTLRLLALVTLKYDVEHQGVLCFEEPENGVYPQQLAHVIGLLKSLSTNFEEDEPDLPLRQVLVNTHAPKVLSTLSEMDLKRLLFTHMTRQPKRETRMIDLNLESSVDPKEAQQLRLMTRHQIMAYLDPVDLDAAHELLRQLNETEALP